MSKIFESFWYKLAAVLFWTGSFGAIVFGNYRPSIFLTAMAFLIIALDSLSDFLKGSKQ